MKYQRPSSIVVMLFCLWLESAAQAEGLCLPKATQAESQSWPICAIYMHGLFGEPPYSESKWEVPFRNSLEKIANLKRCKIAVPFGNQGKYRNWNGVGIAEIKSRAKKVCSGSTIISKPDIIGFSNGANVLRGNSCQTLSQFSQVTLIGPTGTRNNETMKGCGNVRIHQRHEVPSFEYLDRAITYGGDQNERRSDSGSGGAVSLR